MQHPRATRDPEDRHQGYVGQGQATPLPLPVAFFPVNPHLRNGTDGLGLDWGGLLF